MQRLERTYSWIAAPRLAGELKIVSPKELKDAVKDYLKVCKDMI